MGAMADLGIHKTDLIHFLTGQTIVETTASYQPSIRSTRTAR